MSDAPAVRDPFWRARALLCALLRLLVRYMPGTGAGMPPSELHYLRIPKTGSTSMSSMLWADQKPCRGLHYHSHEETAQSLPENVSTFAVLRHPCERFVSTYTFVALLVFGRQRDDDGNELTAAGSPLGWARYLLASAPPNASAHMRIHSACVRSGACAAALYERLTNRAMGSIERGSLDVLRRSIERAGPNGGSLMTAQHSYVRASTQLACLPTMMRDVKRILATNLPDCTALQSRTELHLRRSSPLGNASGSGSGTSAALCELVATMYPRDVELYASACEARRVDSHPLYS